MHNAKPTYGAHPPGDRNVAHRLARHRPRARVFAAGVFITLMLLAGGVAAQQVLMAPKVDLSFDSVEVAGQTDAVNVNYQIAAYDWTWANDFGMDVWMGLYTPQSAAPAGSPTWQLQRVERLGAQQGTVSFEDAVSRAADQVGVCLIAASVNGGKLAPGMGYVCETPLVVASDGGRLDLEQRDAEVGLRFERDVREQPWFTAQRGFGQAVASGAEIDEAEGPFVSYRAPSPPTDVRAPEARRGYDQRVYDRRDYDRRDYDRHGYDRHGYDRHGYDRHGDYRHDYDQRGFATYLDMLIYAGYPPDFSFGRDRFRFDRDRFRVDRFRQRRLDRRRIFGPLDVFDAKFNQDMFGTHPEDVFYNFPVTPGYFGRDAFGRDLQDGFGVPAQPNPGPHNQGLGQPFD